MVLLAAGWGGNAPALKFSLSHLPPSGAAGLRFLIGMAVILLFARLQGVSLAVERRNRAPLAWMGLLFTVQILLLNYGSIRTEASRQALLINSYPLFVPLLAHLFLTGDRLTTQKITGTLLAFVGVLIIFGERAAASQIGLLGDLLVASSAVLLAGKAVYTRALVTDQNHPYQVLFWQMAFAVPLFFGLSLLTEPQQYDWSGIVLLSILYQGVVVAGLCFVGWTSLLKHYNPSRLSVGFFLTPVFGAILSYWLLGEALSGALVAGGAAIVAGLVIVNRRTARTGETAVPEAAI